MRRLAPGPASRPLLLGTVGLGLALAAAAGPLGALLDGHRAIETARARLAAAREAAARPPLPTPLAAPSAEALAAAFRARLDALAEARAVVIDRAVLEADPGLPALPRLRADLRGTAEGLHGLMQALETEPPLLVAEEAALGLDRLADPEIGRPTLMRLALTVRGVLLPAEPAPRGVAP